MQKPPFSSYFDFFSLTYGRGTLPLRTLILPSGTPLKVQVYKSQEGGGGFSDIFIYIGPKYFMYT